MDSKLSAHLKRKYSVLFNKDSNGEIRFGFSCSDGWFGLLDLSFSTVVDYVKNHNSNIDNNIKKNEESSEKITIGSYLSYPKMDQIKEKFGELRIYNSGGDLFTRGVFECASNLSTSTCETCGSPGKLIHGGYIYVACDEHIKNDSGRVPKKELEVDTVIYVLSFKYGMVTAKLVDVENKVIEFSNESDWFRTCPVELEGVKSKYTIEDINGTPVYYEC